MKLLDNKLNPTHRRKWVDSKKVLEPGRKTLVKYEPDIWELLPKNPRERKKP